MNKRMAVSVLAGIGVLVAMGLRANSSADPQLAVTRVKCLGLVCGGTGGSCGTAYAYRVIPGTNASITQVDIGTHDTDITRYTNICGPTGWSISGIFSVSRTHDLTPTAHGSTTTSSGTCSDVVRFTGPAMTTTFDIGFDHPWTYHDVNWKTATDNTQTSWTFPVGQGVGPVHGPLEDH